MTLTIVTIAWLGSASLGAQLQKGGKIDPAISKVSSAYQAAANAEDVAKLVALYTEDAVEMPPNEAAIRGRAAIEAYYKKQFAGADGKATITPTESMVAGNVAYEPPAATKK
jgi:ketosteroid isomerase-like protein